jgi:uncharacterized membrane protein
MNNILRQFLTTEVLFTIIAGALFIFFIDLYGRTKKIWYLVFAILFTTVYLMYIYKLSNKNTDTNVVNLSAKVLPLIILTIMGVLIYKKKFNMYTLIGLFLILIGSIMVAM